MPVGHAAVVSSCSVCTSMKRELACLSTLSGCEFTTVFCPLRCCTSGLNSWGISSPSLTASQPLSSTVKTTDNGFVFYPGSVSAPVEDKTGSLHIIANKSSFRELLLNKPSTGFCVVASARTISGMHTWLKPATLIHTFDMSHPVAVAVNTLAKKPSQVSVFFFRPTLHDPAVCFTLGSQLPPDRLVMRFPAFVKGTLVRVLFDSGATHSFGNISTCRALNLQPSPSSLKSVRIADNATASVQGQYSVDLKMGPLRFTTAIHALPSFLPEIDLILGQDFMLSHHIVLDFEAFKLTRKSVCLPLLTSSA